MSEEEPSKKQSILKAAGVGVVVGGSAGIVYALVRRMFSKDEDEDEDEAA